jgi:peptidyl-prolyl cis-trans isomerase SurA
MNGLRHNAMGRLVGRIAGLAMLLGAAQLAAWTQSVPVAAAPATAGEKQPPMPGVELDRIVAVVNGDLILDSDVDEERRLMAFQPFRQAAAYSREHAIERLIDRTLILQQAKLENEDPITDQQVEAQLATLRKDIPACKEYHCETDAGWQKFVEDQGFTIPELTEIWRKRMQVLHFINIRFRMGIGHISEIDIKDYYDKTLLPEYARQHATAPKLDTISKQIEEILLQQQVSNLLDEWLKALRAQGTVRVLQPGEVAP